jgi:predicted  nucleic acid-binding Zn-ribbon protein
VDADPADQLRLLDLQALDSALDRLADRRRELPELADIERLGQRQRALLDREVTVETSISDLGRAVAKLEADVEQVRARAERDRRRLDAGQVSSPRDLENLQSEVVSLGRRQGVLEDELLEVMERNEQAEHQLAAVRAERATVAAELDAAVRRRDAAFADIDARAGARRGEREALVPTLPADLVALYEKVRAGSGGVGAALLLRRQCQGCHLELSGADLIAVKDAGPRAVVRCEECRRILVRTENSGV